MIARHLTATAPMLSDRHQVIEPGTRVLLRRGTGQRAATIVVQGSVSKNFNRISPRIVSRLAHSTSQNCRLLHVSVQKHAVVLLGLGIRAGWGAPDARGIRPNTDAVVSPRRRRQWAVNTST